jgi:L1 cell adhesion molecule like protein
VPQICVAFDIDANGILNVSAEDKSTGKKDKITITNDKGRLSKDDIERMVQEAEKFKTEDEEVRKRVESRNGLESYVYNMRNVLREDRVAAAVGAEDKGKMEAALGKVSEWLDAHSDAFTPASEFDGKLKEVQDVCAPIVARVYRESGAPDAPPPPSSGSDAEGSGQGGGGGDEPKVEEVD